jgi:hypothetical protein
MASTTLPRCMKEHGTPVYRGLRPESRRTEWSWWAEDEAYAAEYGDVIEGRLPEHANLLDVCEAIGWGRLINGESLDAVEPGLSAIFGLDADEAVPADDLWEVLDTAGKGIEELVAFVASRGCDGMRWSEDSMRITYLLIH